jgi:hypothetical protein
MPALLLLLLVGLGLFFLIRKVAGMEEQIIEEDGVRVALYPGSRPEEAEALANHLIAHGITARVLPAGGMGRSARRGFGVYVDPANQAAALRLVSAERTEEPEGGAA